MIETFNTRDEWLAARRTGIGASDVPTILGLAPWSSLFALWAEKTGQDPGDEAIEKKPWIEWGIRLEQPIAEAFAGRTHRDVTLRPRYSLERNADDPWLLASLDAEQRIPLTAVPQFAEKLELSLPLPVYERPGALQIKTATQFKAKEWIDGIPLYYQVQVQHELAVSGFEWATLCVLIGGHRFITFPDIPRNDKFISAMRPKLERFQELVAAKKAPPIDDSEATARALARMHWEDSGKTVVLPPESAQWDRDLVKVKDLISQLCTAKDRLENLIKSHIGDASYGLLPCGERYSWKTYTKRTYTVPEHEEKPLRRVK